MEEYQDVELLCQQDQGLSRDKQGPRDTPPDVCYHLNLLTEKTLEGSWGQSMQRGFAHAPNNPVCPWKNLLLADVCNSITCNNNSNTIALYWFGLVYRRLASVSVALPWDQSSLLTGMFLSVPRSHQNHSSCEKHSPITTKCTSQYFEWIHFLWVRLRAVSLSWRRSQAIFTDL